MWRSLEAIVCCGAHAKHWVWMNTLDSSRATEAAPTPLLTSAPSRGATLTISGDLHLNPFLPPQTETLWAGIWESTGLRRPGLQSCCP